MKNYILVNSVSSAFRGRDALNRHNIKCSVERTPKNNITKSCGYCLLVHGEVEPIKNILQKNNITVLGVITPPQ
jgi:hypothetical protein